MQGRRRSHVRLSGPPMCRGTDVIFSCESVDYETGTIKFNNGRTVTADLIVGADGIRVNRNLLRLSSWQFNNTQISSLSYVSRLGSHRTCGPHRKPATGAMFSPRTSNALDLLIIHTSLLCKSATGFKHLFLLTVSIVNTGVAWLQRVAAVNSTRSS